MIKEKSQPWPGLTLIEKLYDIPKEGAHAPTEQIS